MKLKANNIHLNGVLLIHFETFQKWLAAAPQIAVETFQLKADLLFLHQYKTNKLNTTAKTLKACQLSH